MEVKVAVQALGLEVEVFRWTVDDFGHARPESLTEEAGFLAGEVVTVRCSYANQMDAQPLPDIRVLLGDQEEATCTACTRTFLEFEHVMSSTDVDAVITCEVRNWLIIVNTCRQ